MHNSSRVCIFFKFDTNLAVDFIHVLHDPNRRGMGHQFIFNLSICDALPHRVNLVPLMRWSLIITVYNTQISDAKMRQWCIIFQRNWQAPLKVDSLLKRMKIKKFMKWKLSLLHLQDLLKVIKNVFYSFSISHFVLELFKFVWNVNETTSDVKLCTDHLKLLENHAHL